MGNTKEMDGKVIHTPLKENMCTPIHHLKNLCGPKPRAHIFVFRMNTIKGDIVSLTDISLFVPSIMLQNSPGTPRKQSATHSAVRLHTNAQSSHKGALHTGILKKRMIGCCRFENVRLGQPKNTLGWRKTPCTRKSIQDRR